MYLRYHVVLLLFLILFCIHIVLLHSACSCTYFVSFFFVMRLLFYMSCNNVVIKKPWVASLDRLRRLWQPAIWCCTVLNIFSYWQINVELILCKFNIIRQTCLTTCFRICEIINNLVYFK